MRRRRFRAAADANRFPEQIAQGLSPWQAKKIYQRSRRDETNQGQSVVTMQTGLYDPLLGKTYFQIGMEGRTYHRCQGMQQLIPLPRDNSSQWKLVDATIEIQNPEGDLYDGIDTSLFAIEAYATTPRDKAPFLHADLAAIERHIEAATAAYHPDFPQLTAPSLAKGLKGVRDLQAKIQAGPLEEAEKFQILFMLDRKGEDFLQALRLAHQLSIEALVDGRYCGAGTGVRTGGDPCQRRARPSTHQGHRHQDSGSLGHPGSGRYPHRDTGPPGTQSSR